MRCTLIHKKSQCGIGCNIGYSETRFYEILKKAKIKQASVCCKFKVILMVVVVIWHQLDNIHSKGNLMLYALHINMQKLP